LSILKFTAFKKIYNHHLFIRIDRKIITYLIFVVIATIFWFINKVGNEFSTTIDYPVTYVNLPSKKVLVSDLPKSLHLSINAYGYDILRYKLSSEPYPIIIDAQKFGVNLNKAKVNQYRLATRYLRENINSQISSEIRVIDIMPDTIYFQFSHQTNKKVPVKSDLKLEFEKESMLNGAIVFKPDCIIVSGPNSILDTLQYITTKQQTLKGFDESIQKNVELQEINNTQFDRKQVVALIPVSKLTEVLFELPVITVNVPDSLKLITFPGTIKLSCSVPFNKYTLTHASDFLVQVDYNDIDKQLGLKLPLILSNSPSQAINISFSPQSVEFILERNK